MITQDFTMDGVPQGRIENFPTGAKPGAWGRKSPSGSRDKAQVRSPGDEAPPPEAEAKCEISIQFLTFSCTKFRT